MLMYGDSSRLPSLLFLGAANVGKNAFIAAWQGESYQRLKASVGVDCFVKVLLEQKIMLRVLVGGQRFEFLYDAFCNPKYADYYCLCFSQYDEASLDVVMTLADKVKSLDSNAKFIVLQMTDNVFNDSAKTPQSVIDEKLQPLLTNSPIFQIALADKAAFVAFDNFLTTHIPAIVEGINARKLKAAKRLLDNYVGKAQGSFYVNWRFFTRHHIDEVTTLLTRFEKASENGEKIKDLNMLNQALDDIEIENEHGELATCISQIKAMV